MEDQVNIKISPDLIKPIIENKIKLAIVDALGNKEDIINNVVDRILTDKVDRQGKKSNYSSDNKFDFIDVTLRLAIEDACKDAIKEFIEENKPLIKIEIQKQLSTKKGTAKFAKSLIDGIAKATESEYRISTKLSFQELED